MPGAVPLLNHLGGPGTVIVVAVLFAAAAAVWHNMAAQNRGARAVWR